MATSAFCSNTLSKVKSRPRLQEWEVWEAQIEDERLQFQHYDLQKKNARKREINKNHFTTPTANKTTHNRTLVRKNK